MKLEDNMSKGESPFLTGKVRRHTQSPVTGEFPKGKTPHFKKKRYEIDLMKCSGWMVNRKGVVVPRKRKK